MPVKGIRFWSQKQRRNPYAGGCVDVNCLWWICWKLFLHICIFSKQSLKNRKQERWQTITKNVGSRKGEEGGKYIAHDSDEVLFVDWACFVKALGLPNDPIKSSGSLDFGIELTDRQKNEWLITAGDILIPWMETLTCLFLSLSFLLASEVFWGLWSFFCHSSSC